MRFAIYIRNEEKEFLGYVYAENIIEALQKAEWDYSYYYPKLDFKKDVIAKEENER